MATLWAYKGTTQEHGTNWEVVGEAPGVTTEEVAVNLAKKDKDFAFDLDPKRLTHRGRKLSLRKA